MMFYYSQQKLIKRLALLESKGRGDEKGDKGAGKHPMSNLKIFQIQNATSGRGTVCDCIKTINFSHCLSLCLFIVAKFRLCNIEKFLELRGSFNWPSLQQ